MAIFKYKEFRGSDGVVEIRRQLRADIKNGLLLGLLLGGLVLGWIFVDKYEWRYWLPYWSFAGLFCYANTLWEDKKERKGRRHFDTYKIGEEDEAA